MSTIEQLGADRVQLLILESCGWESLRHAVIEAESPEATAEEILKKINEIQEVLAKLKKNVKARQKIEKKINALEGF